MNASPVNWIVFDLIGVLAEPSWRDIAARKSDAWDKFKVGQESEHAFWSTEHQRVYRSLLSFRLDRLQLVRGLKSRGFKVAVATNFSRAWLDHLLNPIERDLFDARIISEDVRVAKPAQEFWRKVLEYAPAGSLFVDDRKENCEAAARAGFTSIWAHPACSLEREVYRLLKSGADELEHHAVTTHG